MINQEFRECLQCGWKWVSRFAGTPSKCPRCQSSRWDSPRLAGEPIKPAYGKSRMKYPVDTLEVGQSILLPWITNEAGVMDQTANMLRPRSIAAWARRNGRAFVLSADIKEGLMVKRVK